MFNVESQSISFRILFRTNSVPVVNLKHRFLSKVASIMYRAQYLVVSAMHRAQFQVVIIIYW